MVVLVLLPHCLFSLWLLLLLYRAHPLVLDESHSDLEIIIVNCVLGIGIEILLYVFLWLFQMHDMRMTLTRTVLKFTDGQTASMLTALGIGTLFGGMVISAPMTTITFTTPSSHDNHNIYEPF